MSKVQTIMSLLIFLVIVFSMDMIFGNPLRETFRGGGSRDLGSKSRDLGAGEEVKLKITNDINENNMQGGDDEPLYYSRPMILRKLLFSE